MLLFEYKNLLIYINMNLDNIDNAPNLNLLGLGGDGDDDEEEGEFVPAAFSDDEEEEHEVDCMCPLCKYGDGGTGRSSDLERDWLCGDVRKICIYYTLLAIPLGRGRMASSAIRLGLIYK